MKCNEIEKVFFPLLWRRGGVDSSRVKCVNSRLSSLQYTKGQGRYKDIYHDKNPSHSIHIFLTREN